MGEQESLWHRLKIYLRNPVGPKPTVMCPICQVDTLWIKGLDDCGKEGWDFARVLPCGHMFGHNCLEKALKVRPERCPLCDLNLRYTHQGICTHAVEGIVAPATGRHTIDRVPRTIPEGGRIPLFCSACRASQVRARTLVLAEAIHNIPAGGPPNQALEQQVQRQIALGTSSPSWADYPWFRFSGA